MTPEEIRRLVGGYATGALTDSERSALMQAALEDQDLFDELAREQELKELLDLPGVRPRLVEALKPPAPAPAPFWMRPWAWGGVVAVAALVGVFLLRQPEAPVEIAAVPAPAVSSDAPVAAPAEPALARKADPVPPASPRAAERFSAPALADRKDQPLPPAKEKIAEAESPVRDAVQPKPAGPAVGVVGGVGTLAAEAELKKEQDLRLDQESGKAAALEGRREQAAAAAPPPPPSPAAARSRSAVIAPSAVLANATGRVAFRYVLAGRTLTITPAQAGFLSVSEPQQKAAPVVRRVTPGAEQRFPVPQGAPSMIVTFSTTQDVQGNQRQNVQQQNAQQQVMRDRQGAVNLEPQQDFAVVEITVP